MSEEDILLCSLLFSENRCAEFSASQQVKQNPRIRIKNTETKKNIEKTNALWYYYIITYSVE